MVTEAGPFLEFNEQELLTHAGKVKAEVAKQLAEERYVVLDPNRKQAEALEADREDFNQLEELEQDRLGKQGRLDQ